MRWLFTSLMVTVAFALCSGQKSGEHKTSPAKLTFAVEGLHCENCVANLTKALKGVSGVQKAEVSLKDKRAIVTLDESKTSVSNLVAQIQKQVPYRLTLLLPIENWEKADRNKAAQVIKEVKGIADVREDKSGLLVSFDPKATVRYSELTESLARAGFKVSNSPVINESHEHSSSHQSSCCSECESSHGSSHSGSQHSGCR